MTSGVKQAMPPVLMTKAGLEGKGARSHALQADFAEALRMGKQDSRTKSEDVEAVGGDPVTAWPRLATNLGSAFERHHHGPGEPEIATTRPDREPVNEPGDEMLPDTDPDMPAERSVERDAQQQNSLYAPAMDAAPIVLPSGQELSARAGQMPPAALDDQVPSVGSDVEVHPPARVTGDNPSAGIAAVSTNSPTAAPRATSFVPLHMSETAEPQQQTTRPHFAATAPDEGRVADSLPEAAEPVRAGPRVTVVSQQNAPAPMASTAIALVESIAAGPLAGASKTAPAPNAIHAGATHASAQSLKIQLHPAELGMVTATLRFAGEQLSIELKVETPEAYRRLTSDGDAIVGSLRDLGYDIDKVTILQSSIANSSAQRSDSAAQMPSPASRSGDLSNSSTSNGGNAGSGENSHGRGENNGQGSQKGSSVRPETSDGGLYI